MVDAIGRSDLIGETALWLFIVTGIVGSSGGIVRRRTSTPRAWWVSGSRPDGRSAGG
jgi:hypothetical protein